MADNWKSPTVIISLATLLLSVCGNVFQFYNFQLEKEKWEEDKKGLSARLEVFENQQRVRDARALALKDELDSLDRLIKNTTEERDGDLNVAMVACGRSLDSGATKEVIDDAMERCNAAQEKAAAETKEISKLTNVRKETAVEYENLIGRSAGS